MPESEALVQAPLIQYRTFKRSTDMEIVFTVPLEYERRVKEVLGYINPSGGPIYCAITPLKPEAVDKSVVVYERPAEEPDTKKFPFDHAPIE